MTLDQQRAHIARLGQLWDRAHDALVRRDFAEFDLNMAEFRKLNGAVA